MKMVRSLFAALALAGALTLAACGGPGGGGAAAGPIAISPDGEALAFKPAEAKAKAGTPVVIKFSNTSTAQQHNFVLVKGGEDVAATVDEAAVNVGAPDYLPTENVVAGSSMVAPGGSKDIAFTAPAAGTYTYLCTYPGHYAAGMKGTLTVEP